MTIRARLPIDLLSKLSQNSIQRQIFFQADQRAFAVAWWQVLNLHFDHFAGAQLFGHAGAGDEGGAKTAKKDMAHGLNWQFGHGAGLFADTRQEVVGRWSPGYDKEMAASALDLLQARAAQAGQRASGRDDEHQLFAKAQEFGEVGIIDRLAYQAQLDTVIVQHLDNLIAVAGTHKKVYLRVRVMKLHDSFGQKAAGQRLHGANGDAPALALLAQARGLDALI